MTIIIMRIRIRKEIIKGISTELIIRINTNRKKEKGNLKENKEKELMRIHQSLTCLKRRIL